MYRAVEFAPSHAQSGAGQSFQSVSAFRQAAYLETVWPQKLILIICPPVPTSQPAPGVAKATAQHPLTPGSTYQVVPSSGVHAAPPLSAVTTTECCMAWQ